MADSFAHLHVHTEYSMLDGAARLAELFAEVERQGMPAVAMTDHGNVFGAFEFFTQAKKTGVKPVIGIEAYKTPGTHRSDPRKVRWANGGEADVGGGGAYTHMTLLAENATGLRSLFALSSRASLEGQVRVASSYAPRVDEELLAEYAEGLIATTGCLGGEVHTWLKIGNFDKACAAAGRLVDIFGRDNVFLEVMDHGIDIERAVRADLLRLGRKLKLAPLATNDAHYVRAEQAHAHDALLCVQTGKSLADEKRFRFHGEGYHIKTPAQMRALWDAEVPGACDNTLLIADRVQSYDEVFAPRDLMPRFPVPEGHTEESFLRERVSAGLARRYPAGVPADRSKQADFELGVINQMGFPSYFLVVEDYVAWARSQGIVVGPGRGSAAGSLVAYALGITDLDPIPHGLVFERFLNPARVTMPDIDIDFSVRRREEVIRYVTDKWGVDRVAHIGTYGGMKAKQAIKDAARVLGLAYGVGDAMSRKMPKDVMGKSAPLSCVTDPKHPRYGEAAELRELLAADETARQVFDLALQFEGQKRGWGVHAAGVIVCGEDLLDTIPVHAHPKTGLRITQFDMGACEAMNALKMDFLGLRNLDIIEDAVANVRANRGAQVRLSAEQLDDEATYELIARGDTLGVFQLDGGPMRALLRAMRPTSFADVSAVIALYRPGPMGANAHTDYADRKNGRKPVVPLHPELAQVLEPILAETHGVIVYQEQVTKIAEAVAGYSAARADLLRRAMGKKKKEVLDAEFVGFRDGMLANGFSDDAVTTLWDILVPFADYAFNKAHSAAYGLISYWTAYLKAHYPAEYMAALLSSVGDDKDKLAMYLAECRHMGIQVLVPDVNDSGAAFTAVGADVRFGLLAISGLGAGAVDSLIRTRESAGGYASFADWLAKSEETVCNTKTVEALIKAGAFDSLGHTRRGLFEIHADALAAVKKGKKVEATGQLGMFDLVSAEDGPAALAVDVPAHEWSDDVRLKLERDALGLYISGHPLAKLGRLLAAHGKDSIAELVAPPDEDAPVEPVQVDERGRKQHRKVQVAGIIAEWEALVARRSGKRYVRAVVEDLDASITVMLFERALDAIGDRIGALGRDVVVAVRGAFIREDEGAVKIFADDVMVLDADDAASKAPLVTLSVVADELTPALVAKLRELSQTYPGKSPLVVRLRNPRQVRETTVLTPARVHATNLAFVRDACALFGPNCLAA